MFLSAMMNCWPSRCTAMAKRELLYAGTFGLAAWLAGLVFIDRMNREKAQKTMQETAEHIHNHNVGIYDQSPHCIVCFCVNTLRPRQDGRHFAADNFKCIFFNENVWILIRISLKFVPKGPINNIPALVEIMAWRRPGDKPLSEPMMVRLPTQFELCYKN